MKKLTTTCISLMMLAWIPAFAAETSVLEFWECKLQDGKTMDDAAKANKKWLELQHEDNHAEIRSWALTAIVGDLDGFYWLDSFPSLDAWTKSRLLSETPAGQAVDAELDAAVACTRNRVYRATEH
ncbi:MAG: hypothetical protein AB7I04_16525 [Pseudomonadales bacterium]